MSSFSAQALCSCKRPKERFLHQNGIRSRKSQVSYVIISPVALFRQRAGQATGRFSSVECNSREFAQASARLMTSTSGCSASQRGRCRSGPILVWWWVAAKVRRFLPSLGSVLAEGTNSPHWGGTSRVQLRHEIACGQWTLVESPAGG
jgi:hypothetical protein